MNQNNSSQNKNQPRKQPGDLTPYDGNILQVFGNKVRLVLRLMADSRVSPLLKLLPVASLIYTIWPLDFLPVNPIDDVSLIMIANYFFLEMCPPDVVDEHLASFQKGSGYNPFAEGQTPPPPSPSSDDDVIDGEFQETRKD